MSRYSPSGNCCACLLFEDGWADAVPGLGIEVIDGEWARTVAPGAFGPAASSASGLLLTTQGWTSPFVAEVKLLANLSDVTYRLIVGWQDSANYTFLEMIVGCFPAQSFVSLHHREHAFRLVHVTDGVEDVLDICPYSTAVDTTGDCQGDYRETIGLGEPQRIPEFNRLLLCYDGITLSGSANWFDLRNTDSGGGGADALFTAEVELHGGRVGVQIESTGGGDEGGAGSAFDLLVTRVNSRCETCIENCCEGPVPENLLVSLAGTFQTFSGSPLAYDDDWLVGQNSSAGVDAGIDDGYTCAWRRGNAGSNTPLIIVTKVGSVLTCTVSGSGPQLHTFVFRADLEATEQPTRCVDWSTPIELTFVAAESSPLPGTPTCFVSVP